MWDIESHQMGDRMSSYQAFGLILAWPFTNTDSLRSTNLVVDMETDTIRHSFATGGVAESSLGMVGNVWKTRNIIRDLKHWANFLLKGDFNGWRLHTDRSSPGSELLRWRYVSLALPAGVLIAAAPQIHHRPPLQLHLLDRSMAPSGPVAHLHLHIGAASSFEALWTGVMNGGMPGSRTSRSGKTPQGIGNDEWFALLLRAALSRPVLSQLSRDPNLDLDDAILRAWKHRSDLAEPIHKAVTELIAGKVGSINSLREALLRRALPSFGKNPPSTLEDLWRNDLIQDGGDWPEGAMLARILERPCNAERLLLQYLRIKCMLHRILTHLPGEQGLMAFADTFKQMRPYKSPLKRLLADFAMREDGLDLRAVEVRTAPPQSVREAVSAVTDLKMRSARSSLEACWIYHFIRDSGTGQTTGQRYRDQYRQFRRSGATIAAVMKVRPDLLNHIRGLDIAGVERSGPLWLAVPVFLNLRRLSSGQRNERCGPPLRFTFHVGEDFAHLASGLRAIHEPFAWNMIERGDRLGHALALGISPVDWALRHPQVSMPRWERMMDLAWMLAWYNRRFSGVRADGHRRLSIVESELQIHLHEAGIRCSYQAMVDLFVDVLGDERSLPSLLDKHVVPEPATPLYILWRRLFGGEAAQKMLDAPVLISPGVEVDMLRSISDELTRILGLWQIAIEVNPTSNFLIAGFEHILQQPIFRLHPLDGHDGKALPVTISADDPLVFATNLADEYAYTWASLVISAGVAPGYARKWIDEAAQVSWRARFSLPDSGDVS